MAADVPKIVLTPLERSHHFGRRECVANEILKVGRSVDRRRISPNNLIFDCRVLSRNHAQIWFENGKFFIKDTKSSNGTFVNENRLSPSGEESGPVELKSRDIVQFGVNVNVDKKVTHGCIIATVKLYLNEVEVPGHEPPVQQVLHIIQSALAREQELESKLASMQGVINVAKDLASESMIAIVKEDELMSRLEMMESQLQIYSRNATDDELKQKLKEAYEEKRTSDLSAKDTIRNILQEKLECLSKLSQLQRDYDKAEEECQKYKMLYDNAKQEHTQEISKLGTELSKAETERKNIQEKMTEEKQSLAANLESVQAEADFTKEQLDLTKTRLSETKSELVELKIKVETERQRNIKRIAVTEGSAEEPMSATLLPPGTEEPIVVPNLEQTLVTDLEQVPPGTVVPSQQPQGDSQESLLASKPLLGEDSGENDQVLEPVADVTFVTLDEARVSPVATGSSGVDRRATLLPARSTPEKISRLETELKSARERIAELEEQLLLVAGPGAAIPGPVVTSSASEVVKNSEEVVGRIGSLESSLETGRMGQHSLGVMTEIEIPLLTPRPEVDLAKKFTEMIIARSQVIVLQQYLQESRDRIKRLEEHLRLLEPSDGDSSLTDLLEKLERAESESSLMAAENNTLKDEIEAVKQELQKEKTRNKKLKNECDKIRADQETLRQRYGLNLDENINYESSRGVIYRRNAAQQTPPPQQQQQQQQVCGKREIFQQQQKEVEEQHVKILTILALVSIGVALASWFM